MALTSKREDNQKIVLELKVNRKLLRSERFDDKTRAERVSLGDYEELRVEQGTIIHATKDFKALSFKEIVDKHVAENPQLS